MMIGAPNTETSSRVTGVWILRRAREAPPSEEIDMSPSERVVIDMGAADPPTNVAHEIEALLEGKQRLAVMVRLPEKLEDSSALRRLRYLPPAAAARLSLTVAGPIHGQAAQLGPETGSLGLVAKDVTVRDIAFVGTRHTPALMIRARDRIDVDRVGVIDHLMGGITYRGGKPPLSEFGIIDLGLFQVPGQRGGGPVSASLRDVWFGRIRPGALRGTLITWESDEVALEVEGIASIDQVTAISMRLAGAEVKRVLARDHQGALILPEGVTATDLRDESDVTTEELVAAGKRVSTVMVPWGAIPPGRSGPGGPPNDQVGGPSPGGRTSTGGSGSAP